MVICIIKMYYYNADDFSKLVRNGKICLYSERIFERLTNWQYDEEGNNIKPFRDEYSIKFLKDTYDLEFINEEDWYAIHSPTEGKFCLSGLSKTMKYGLTLLDNSKYGISTDFKVCEKRIWKTLDTMPIDILIAVNISEYDRTTDFILGVDYIIENYPFNGKTIELNVMSRPILKEDGYEVEGKFYRKDGKYYTESIELEYLDGYYDWREHLEEFVEIAEIYVMKEYPIINKTVMYNLVDFLEKINIDVNIFLDFNDYANNISLYKSMLKDNEITQKEYESYIIKEQVNNNKEYKQYLWLLNDLKIISHLYVLPEARISRKLLMLIVDKYTEGFYVIWDTLTVKYPEFDEILFGVSELYTEQCERYVIVVDVEEKFISAHDMKKTNCGFKITKNCIEIFDHNDAIKLFVSIVQEVIASGNLKKGYGRDDIIK